jgi:DNA-binding CsgD family transcriptional regulator
VARSLINLDSIIEEIYRASVTPERWYNVLNRMVEISDAEGALLFTSGAGFMRWICSPQIVSIVQDWIASGWVDRNSRARLMANTEPRFLTDYDGFTPEELETDPFYQEFLRPHGLGWCVGTVIHPSSGDTVVLSIEKSYEKGPVDREAVERLNSLRPHLERAALLSAAAGLEHARTVVDLLQTTGVPAIVLNRRAQSMAANPALLSCAPTIGLAADDRLMFSDPRAQASYAKALAAIADPHSDVTRRSIVISDAQHDPHFVVHLIRFDDSARSIFSDAQFILVVTHEKEQPAPDPALLMNLFDLTPTEARIASLLVKGHSVRTIADMQGVETNTVRMQLKAVFNKTGVHRQAQLVSFLTQKSLGRLDRP